MAYSPEASNSSTTNLPLERDELKQGLIGGWWHGVSPEERAGKQGQRLDGQACELNISRLSPRLVTGLAILSDVGSAMLALIATIAVLSPGDTVDAKLAFVPPALLIVSFGAFHLLGMYTDFVLLRYRAQALRSALVASIAVPVSAALAALQMRHLWPELVLAVAVPLFVVVAVRMALCAWFRQLAERGQLCEVVALLGEQANVKRVRRTLRRVRSGSLARFRNYCVDVNTDDSLQRELELLVNDVRAGLVDDVVLVSDHRSERQLLALGKVIRNLPVDLRLYPVSSRGLNKLIGGPRLSWQSATVALADNPMAGWGGVAKAAFDRVVGACLLVCALPVLLFFAAAVKLTSTGPVFFVQARFGYNCRPFPLVKFRSMYTDRCDLTASQLTSRDDPRVTPIGRFLRKTSLDELPQLINVVAGHMSLVGPRPHVTAAKAGASLYDDLIPTFHSRYRVKPGLTGLAQVRGQRGNTETEQCLTDRFRSDIEYIREWSIALDLKILMWTAIAILRARNAY